MLKTIIKVINYVRTTKIFSDKTSVQVAMDLLSFAAKYTTYSEINHNVHEYFKDVDALTLSIIYDLLDLGVDNKILYIVCINYFILH